MEREKSAGDARMEPNMQQNKYGTPAVATSSAGDGVRNYSGAVEVTGAVGGKGRYERMPNFGIWTNGFFGTASNASSAPSQSGSSRYEDDSIVVGTKPSFSITSTSSKTLHGVITSALWTIARTPALVEAIDRTENRFDGTKKLSSVLRALRNPAVLTDSSRCRDATENADAYLAASTLSIYDSMKPMDAIRGIAGLCGDSEAVLKEAVEATYKTTISCSALRCPYREERGLEREEYLRCTRRTVQLTVDSRAICNTTTKRYHCKGCRRKVAAKTFVMVVPPPPCLVATWPCLTPADPAQEKLILRPSPSESVPYKLSVVITSHQKKTVCMFREGQDYYRVEGHHVKKVQATEWLTAKPQLALFTRQQPPGGAGASVVSIPPTPNRAGGGGGGSGKKRRRDGGASFSEGAAVWGPTAAKAAEVIEVNDDDSDEGVGPVRVRPPGDHAEDGDTSEVNSRRGRKGYRPGAAVEGGGAGGPAGGAGGGSGSARDAGGRGLKRAPAEALDKGGEEVRNAGESSVGASRDRGEDGGRPDAFTEPSGAEARPLARESIWSVPLFKRFFGAGAAGEPDLNFAPDVPRPPSSPVGRSPSDRWEQYGGNWGEGSDSANRRGGSKICAAGMVTRGQQSAAETHDRKSPSHENLTTGDEGLRPEDDNSDDDVQLVTSGAPGGARRGGTLASSSPAKAARADETGDDDDRDSVEEMESRKRHTFWGPGARVSAVATPSPAPTPASSSSSLYTSAVTPSSGSLPRVRSSYSPPHASDVIDSDGTNAAAAVAAAVISAIALSADLSVSGDAPSSSAGTASSSRRPRAAQSRSERREVDTIDDAPTAPPPDEGQREEDEEEKIEEQEESKFIGPARPSPEGVRFVGPARPRPRALPWRQQQLSDFRFEACTAPARESRKESLARSGGSGGSGGGGGDGSSGGGGSSSGGDDGGGSDNGGGFRGGNVYIKKTSSLRDAAKNPPARIASNRNDDEWLPRAGTREPAGGFGPKKNVGGSREGTGARVGAARGGPMQKVMEDLTEADGSSQETDGGRSDGGGGRDDDDSSGGDGLMSRVSTQRDEMTLTTIRGINLQQDHFDRIVNSDGWLTSQIIDIRVKQLQEKYPENLYFDSSFFGFLCPTTDKEGAFVVDYERVRGWTKSSRLPAGKSSLFDLRKLFIPINQGNVHWVLVVVDMEDPDGEGKSDGSDHGGGGGSKVSFYDSFGKDGTSYVEAVQQYLVSELSSRDKTREGLFATEPTPPRNSPRQDNGSDCGVLMLHVMEKLSAGPASGLTSLSQGEVMCLRLQLVANIRE